MAHGRPPVSHAWPLNHCLKKIDISDPHTFLAVKRGILQYAWLKPILAIVSIIMKATDTYEEGYLGITSGYLWTGIVYNISVTVSLYSLAMFWVCLHDDLLPFRPIPKFLSVKLIIFASYWQGFFLSILQWLGAFGNGLAGYTPDNLAAAIQDSLICFEMPIFAIVHWYAFSWHDYADPTVSAARMPVKYALRDAFGIKDLVEDTKLTMRGENYEYRIFDSGDNVIAHEESHSRVKRVMDGMRYERGGKAKYWIPKPGEASKPGEVNSRTPLLAGGDSSQRGRSERGSRGSTERYRSYSEIDITMDDEDERLFTNARALEYGDWHVSWAPNLLKSHDVSVFYFQTGSLTSDSIRSLQRTRSLETSACQPAGVTKGRIQEVMCKRLVPIGRAEHRAAKTGDLPANPAEARKYLVPCSATLVQAARRIRGLANESTSWLKIMRLKKKNESRPSEHWALLGRVVNPDVSRKLHLLLLIHWLPGANEHRWIDPAHFPGDWMENQSKKSLRPKLRLEQPQPKLVRTIVGNNPIDGLTMAWMKIGMYGVDRYRISGTFFCMIPNFPQKGCN